MDESEYHPHNCLSCFKPIFLAELMVIIEDEKENPRYYHKGCLLNFFDLIARLQDYPEKWNGANDERF